MASLALWRSSTFDKGKLTLGAQSSAGEVGVMAPPLSVDAEQQEIYSTRLGTYMQDVNLTPDFPTAASTAQAMWEKKTGQRVDGVISLDPVALGYILDATGPVTVTDPELVAIAKGGLPTELSGKNVVRTLLSDVYAKIEQPSLQDAYFAGVAKEIFGALSSGQGDAKSLIAGMTKGAAAGRVLVWSGDADEQTVIAKYRVERLNRRPQRCPRPVWGVLQRRHRRENGLLRQAHRAAGGAVHRDRVRRGQGPYHQHQHSTRRRRHLPAGLRHRWRPLRDSARKRPDQRHCLRPRSGPSGDRRGGWSEDWLHRQPACQPPGGLGDRQAGAGREPHRGIHLQ